MLLDQTHIQTSSELLQQFDSQNLQTGQRIRFEGTNGRDVYNITAPFMDRGELIIAGRVEVRHTEFSQVMFFRQEDDVWVPHPEYQVYDLQDPFFTWINGELIFGGVRVIPDPLYPENIVSWVTQLYRGKDIASLELFLMGPYHMKDLRLIELASGEIGVLTRPQGFIGGRGQIGFYKVRSLEEINVKDIAFAPLFPDMFIKEEWGGANEPHLLANGLVGVLGHIASFDENGLRHYHAMGFAFNPDTMERTPVKIIARRSNFPEGASKRIDLTDVIFSGGLIRKANGLADFYAGASDAEAYQIEIPDPFLEYEQLDSSR
ncbi:DUF1861 family protein [Paenibacillus sepulcri]|uniref:DUF1861 family protein n=1 Tax=Paenibacillus sepulcri TaxID=359917 RepID=A0ABS7C4I8_9BACL|nr:DUF1861 family protein [Paenibacillus sepulcri]